MHWIPGSGEATGFAVQMGKTMGCGLGSSAIVARTVEYAVPHVLWLASLVRHARNHI